jgi:hypothetical protein
MTLELLLLIFLLLLIKRPGKKRGSEKEEEEEEEKVNIKPCSGTHRRRHCFCLHLTKKLW